MCNFKWMRCRRPRLVWLLAGTVLFLPACGDDGNADPQPAAARRESPGTLPAGTGHPIGVTAGDLYFEPETLEAPAGPVAFTLVNEGAQPHSLVLDKLGGFRLEVAARDDQDKGSVDLKPGEYTYFCDIPGHRAAGMEGTLTVR